MTGVMPVVSASWLGWLAAAAWRFRPAVPRDPRVEVVRAPLDHDPDHLRPVGRFADLGRSLTRRAPVLADIEPRLVATCAALAPVVLMAAGPAGLVMPLGVLAVGRAASRRRLAVRQRAFVDQLADVVEMMRVATSSGLTAGPALAAAQRHAPVGRDAGLGHVVERVRRGESLEVALASWVERHGPPADELAALVRSADRSGVAIGAGLHRLAVELRRRRRVGAETRARRLPVTMLGPLVVCVLPAFGLITVVPMIVVGVSGLSP